MIDYVGFGLFCLLMVVLVPILMALSRANNKDNT